MTEKIHLVSSSDKNASDRINANHNFCVQQLHGPSISDVTDIFDIVSPESVMLIRTDPWISSSQNH